MPPIAGMNARVYVRKTTGTTPARVVIGQMKDVTIEITQKDIDVTSLDSDGWEEYISGIKGWSVDTDGFFIYDDAGQNDMDEAMIDAEPVEVEFYPKDGEGANGYKGLAVITKWSIKGSTGDAVQLNVSMKGNGALAKVVKSAS